MYVTQQIDVITDVVEPEHHSHVRCIRWEARFSRTIAHCETSQGSRCNLPYSTVPFQSLDKPKVTETLELIEVHHIVVVLVGRGHQRLQKHPARFKFCEDLIFVSYDSSWPLL